MSDPISATIDPPPPNKPMSIALARAVAEAADGFTGFGNTGYLVAPYVAPEEPFGGGFHVHGPYGSWDKVPSNVRDLVFQETHGFFGPFEIPGPTPGGPRVTGVDIHIEGAQNPYPFSADHLDALFFSPQAVEKFALPYYERIYGPKFAEHMTTQFQLADVQVMAHYPWSEYSDGTMPIVRVPQVPMLLRLNGDDAPQLIPLRGPKDARPPHGDI